VNDKRANLTRRRRCGGDPEWIDPTFDLAARPAPDVGDQVSVAPQHGVTAPQASILVESRGDLLVDASIP
jgi:hypothetical protein